MADARRGITEDLGIKRELASLAADSARLESVSKSTRISLRRLQELAGGAKPTGEELQALARVLPGRG